MTDSERLGHTLVAIPIAHVLGSAFFLWSYCLGFGANIVAYASASDLLTVSISDMVRVYATSLLLPLLLTAVRLTSPNPYAADWANSLPESQQADARKINSKIRNTMDYIGIAGFILVASLTAWEIYKGRQFPYFLIWAGLQIPVALVWMRFCENRHFSKITFESGSILFSFIIAIFAWERLRVSQIALFLMIQLLEVILHVLNL